MNPAAWDRRLALALALPLLGFALLVGRAELLRAAGLDWLLPIRGYDPRDLLSGHYLVYAFDLGDQPVARCSQLKSQTCCLCLEPGPGGRRDPALSLMSCAEAESCAAWLPEPYARDRQRFYIPEERGPELEDAVRDHRAAVLLSVRAGGQAMAKELYLDGEPWMEAVNP